MRFGPWYPLADAAAHTPAGEGVLQVRVAAGLLDYPRGKTAMVHYEHAPDLRARVVVLAAAHAHAPALWCRYLDREAAGEIDLAAAHASVLAAFVRRFGCAPSFELVPRP